MNTKQNDNKLDNFADDEIEKESVNSKGPAISYGADYTLDTVAQYVQNHSIIVQPHFQRKEVWDKNKSSKLIESFLLGYPVPNILLGRPQNDDKMEVIDGQQRIVAISGYLKGIFRDSVFRLTGDIIPKYLNKSFTDLDDVDQRRLQNSILKATILVYSNNDPDLKFSVFQRINTGSVILTQQEIRNCIYGGSFNELLHELNKETQWRSFLSAKLDPRMRDEETILRFFASLYNKENYEKPMTKFLNKFMEKHQNIDSPQKLTWKNVFLETLTIIKTNFPNGNPFALTPSSKQFNRAAFEAIMVTMAELKADGKSDFTDFETKSANLLKNSDFQDSISTGTSSEKKYRQRFDLAMRFLK